METSHPQIDLRRDLIRPLKAQERLLDGMYEHEYILFGGAAGPGKSYTLRWAAVEYLMWLYSGLGIKNAKVGLFCEDYPALKDRQIGQIKRQFPKWLGEVKDTISDGLGFYLSEQYGGGIIVLRNLDDPSKYASSEFAAIFVDELTKNDRQTFDDLRFRKRWPGVEHSPFIAASNPGSKGHAWVKKLWIDRDFSGDDENLQPETFLFIPAKAKENPHLPGSYWETLRSLPPKMRKAMEEGDWDIFAGQFFSEWRRDMHVCKPFEIPWQWRRVIGIDYGYSKPSAVGWWAIDPDGHLYLYREVYETQLTYQKLAEIIMEMTGFDEQIDLVIADPAIWGDRQRHQEEIGFSGAEIMQRAFMRRGFSLVRGNHDRLQGWARMHELMMPRLGPDEFEYSLFSVFENCTNFIRTVPSLVYNSRSGGSKRIEDLDTDGEDHHADAARYVVNHVFDKSETIRNPRRPKKRYSMKNRIAQYLDRRNHGAAVF